MQHTKIEWIFNPDNSRPGWSWSPITGCLNHTPEGLCLGGLFPCYAYKLANGRLKQRYLANDNLAPLPDGLGFLDAPAKRDPFYPRFWEERLTALHMPRKADSPKKGIFPCDMGDLFGDCIPQSWQEQVFNAIKANPDYRFYLLTKQPANLIQWSPFPENCWVGVSVCNDKMLDVAVDKLEDIQAKIKFISFEPLLKRLTLSLDYALYYSGVSWLIIGACTGTHKDIELLSAKYPELWGTQIKGNKWALFPKIEWVREIVEAADRAGIPVFLEDNLKPLIKWREDTPWAFESLSNMLRQEMP